MNERLALLILLGLIFGGIICISFLIGYSDSHQVSIRSTSDTSTTKNCGEYLVLANVYLAQKQYGLGEYFFTQYNLCEAESK